MALGRLSGAVRRRFIGTLAGQRQARYRGIAQVRRKLLCRHGVSPCRCRPRRPAEPMHIALYEPDIAQNTGTILRLCACLGVAAHIIEPAGFPVSDRAFRRAGMDYLDQVTLTRHASWAAFDAMAARRDAHGSCCSRRARRPPISITAYGERRAAVRARIVRRARCGPCRRRRAADDPDAARPALAQCRDGLRDGGRRGAAADARSVGLMQRARSCSPCGSAAARAD